MRSGIEEPLCKASTALQFILNPIIRHPSRVGFRDHPVDRRALSVAGILKSLPAACERHHGIGGPWRPYAAVRACTSARPASTVSTISSGKYSVIPVTKRWVDSPTISRASSCRAIRSAAPTMVAASPSPHRHPPQYQSLRQSPRGRRTGGQCALHLHARRVTS